MDESFQRRANRLLDGRREAAPLEHDMLSAALAAQQAASPAACAQARASAARSRPGEAEPLTELLLAGPAWRHAATAQSGCFNRIEVKRRLNPR